MDYDLFEDIGKHYHTTLVNFFLPMNKEQALAVHQALTGIIDDTMLNVNFFIPSLNVVRETLYSPVRNDPLIFNAFIKLERLMAVKLALLEVETTYYTCLSRMFHLDGVESENVVDHDTRDLLGTPQDRIVKSLMDIQKIPGLVGLLTAIQYRHVWESIKGQ